jgi:hypothetical protein
LTLEYVGCYLALLDLGGCSSTASIALPKFIANIRAAVSDAKKGPDRILFYHGMYVMRPKQSFVEKALEAFVRRQSALVAVFHSNFVNKGMERLETPLDIAD